MSNIIAEKINKDNVSVFSIEEGGLMIYNQLTENTPLLNETAAFLYDLAEKPSTLNEIIAAFKEKYDFPDDTQESLDDDIIEMLDEMSNKGLLTIRRV